MTTKAIKVQFAANFKRAIDGSELRELPLKKLGKIFGVSGTTVHYWRTGEKMPDMPHAMVVAARLAVNVEWLLTNRGAMRIREGISYKAASLLNAFEGMPDKEKGEILAFTAFVLDRLGDKNASKELASISSRPDQDLGFSQ